MTNKDIDTLLHVSLKPDYTPSDDLNQRLQERIHNGNDTAVLYHFHGSQRDKKKKSKAAFVRFKRVAAIACVLIFAFGSVGVAGGKIKYMVGLKNLFRSSNYNEIERVVEQVGFEAHVPDCLSEDYVFDEICIEEVADEDDNGRLYDNRDVIRVFYKSKSGEPSISLEISGEDETLKYDTIPKEMKEENERRRNSGYTHSREIDGLEVEYFSDTFLFVPNDYEPTEEEESLDETDPNFYISYGGDQDPYYSHGQTIVFVLDGITYEMQVFDSWMSEDEFYEMGEQLITYIMSEK